MIRESIAANVEKLNRTLYVAADTFFNDARTLRRMFK
jgi:hypothetical protein